MRAKLMHRRKAQSGFSLIELLVVMFIILAIAAMATPTLLKALYDMRLRGAAASLQGLFQQARMQAVKDNKAYTVRSITQPSGEILAYIDTDNDSQKDTNESSISLPRQVTFAATGFPATTSISSNLGTTNLGTPATSLAISFNSRGLPCTGLPACRTMAPYVYFMSEPRSGMTGTETAWAAVTVTQAGRVKAWMWSGSLAAGQWQ